MLNSSLITIFLEIMAKNKFILKVNCVDEKGIIARITNPLFEIGCMINTLDQYADTETNRFFMRLSFEGDNEREELESALEPINKELDGTLVVIDQNEKMKVLILCSKPDHCVNDILVKVKRGALPLEVCAVASNHNTLQGLTEWHDYEFHHLPVTRETKPQQEAQIGALFESKEADLIVLARYMQILSPEFCERYSENIINIHHSFLPSFKGASPYKQAHGRGVKMIGATAHYVTSDLDEGPIISQEIIRVKHSDNAQDLARYGADVECITLSRALKYHAEHRVFINRNKTVVLK